MRVVFTDRALGDLDALRTYITEDNPTAAQAQVYTILSQVALLATHPLLGHSGRIVGTRELVIAQERGMLWRTWLIAMSCASSL
jgi:toxin ParE1/3/4